MDCDKCGTHNLDGAERCRLCGNPFVKQGGSSSPERVCPFCHTKNPLDSPFCSGCNRLISPMKDKLPQEEERKSKREKYYDRIYADYPSSGLRSARLGLAGIIFIMCSFFVFVDIAFTLGLGYEATQMEDYDRLLDRTPALKSAIPNLVACQGIRVVFASLAVLGGLAAMRKVQFGFAVAGGVFSIFALGTSVLALILGWWLILTGILFLAAILGLVLVIISRREFKLA